MAWSVNSSIADLKMDSLFIVDKNGYRKSSLPAVVYERDRILLEEKDDKTRDIDNFEAEVKLFGLKLDHNRVDIAVGSSFAGSKKSTSEISEHLDKVCKKVAKAVESSFIEKQAKQKRVRERNSSGIPLNMLRNNVEKNMQRSMRYLDPGLDQRNALPTVSKRLQPVLNNLESKKTLGNSWLNLPATEINEDIRNELKIIQMRSVLNPSQFYKKNDLKTLPKYFQIGVVEHSPLNHYNEKNTRKIKKSLVDDLLQDEAFQKFNKRRYNKALERSGKYSHRKNINKKKKK